MQSTKVLHIIIAAVLLLIVPGAIGWSTGRGRRGKGIVRAVAGLALLTGIPGAIMILRELSNPAGYAPPRGNDFAFAGGQYLYGGVLVAAAVLLATVACAGAIGQARIAGGRGRLTVLVFLSALPLTLSVSLFVLDFAQDGPNRTLLLGAFVCGVLGPLMVAVFAFFGLARSGPGRVPVSSGMP